jgi:3-deoxy-D-manno-octulosonic-acid transferase
MMGFWCYNLLWRLLLPPTRVLALCCTSWRRQIKDRLSLPLNPQLPSLWFHCASLGEAKGMAGLLLSLEFPGSRLLVTASTRAGTEFLQKELCPTGAEGPSIIRLAPLDHPTVVRQFLKAYRIRVLCLYEGELWPNYLRACREEGIPVMLVSARLSRRADQIYSFLKGAFKRLLGNIAWIQAQNSAEADKLRRLAGVDAAVGIDYKAAFFLRCQNRSLGQRENRRAFAFLSLHKAEIKMLLGALPQLMKKYPIVLVPRYPGQATWAFKRLSSFGFELYSVNPQAEFLLVDEHGKIPRLLERCHTCFIGGTMAPRGGHNVWEPLLAGVYMTTGRWYFNQQETIERLLESGMAEVIERMSDLSAVKTGPLPAEKVEAVLNTYRSKLEDPLSELRVQCEKCGCIAKYSTGKNPNEGGVT